MLFARTKLIVLIPAFDEAPTIATVVRSVPRKIRGISSVKVLVWDDGSTDQTAKLAKKAGADFVFRNKRNLGLARTFQKAKQKAIELGANIIVNTDADNQYDQQEIPFLIQPIMAQVADVVIGDRQVRSSAHMPLVKKYGNMCGSWFIRWLTGLRVNDSSSGFRAYTADALRSVNTYSQNTYTHETLVQAHFNDLTIAEIPVSFRPRPPESGKSRLIRSVPAHVVNSSLTIVRTILMYRAFQVLGTLGMIEVLAAVLIGGRYIWFWERQQSGHVQSLILASMFFTLGLCTILVGVLADLLMVKEQIHANE